MAEEDPPSPLFKLPGELRNRIYRLCMLQDTIRIWPHTRRFPEHPLLSVSKAVRAEAATIFYGENRMCVHVMNYDSTNLVRFVQRPKAIGRNNVYRGTITLAIDFGGPPNWSNLQLWLQNGHSDHYLLFAALPSNVSFDHKLIDAMQAMVRESEQLPWDCVQKQLLPFRKPLIAIDKRWAD